MLEIAPASDVSTLLTESADEQLLLAILNENEIKLLDIDLKRLILRFIIVDFNEADALERKMIIFCADNIRQQSDNNIQTTLEQYIDWKETVLMLGAQMKEANANMLALIELQMLAHAKKEVEIENAKEVLQLIEKRVKRKIHNMKYALLNKINELWKAMNCENRVI